MRKVQKDLVAMKVVELKEELGERGEALSGNKAWLRRIHRWAQVGGSTPPDSRRAC